MTRQSSVVLQFPSTENVCFPLGVHDGCTTLLTNWEKYQIVSLLKPILLLSSESCFLLQSASYECPVSIPSLLEPLQDDAR